jgi:hypothetical protein
MVDLRCERKGSAQLSIGTSGDQVHLKEKLRPRYRSGSGERGGGLRAKKSRTARVSAVRLGGGGNEDLESHVAVDISNIITRGLFFHQASIRLDLQKDPGLVQPAERLRAVLSVGTNRASLTSVCLPTPFVNFFTNSDP